jgi:DNA-binding CsgD family transcriptional regulator
MPTTDSALPAFYLLFGAFIVLVGLHLWRSLRQRFSSPGPIEDGSKAFSVRIIDDASPSSNNRQWQWDTLTPREMEVAQLAAQGKRNSEIARDLHISVRTVETHLANIYAKLHVRSRTELARIIRDLVD